MQTKVKNYWSLYLDFLHDFKDLKYSGFSLPYLCHFTGLIRNNDEIYHKLNDKEFTKQLINQVNDQKEIQEAFDQFKHSHTKQPLVKNNEAKVLLNFDTILRFPKETFIECFDPAKTLIIMAGDKNWKRTKKPSAHLTTTPRNPDHQKEVSHIPTDYLSNYPIATPEAVMQVKNKALDIFNVHTEHHLYKNINFQNIFLAKITEIIHRIEQTKCFLQNVSISCIVVSNTHSFISRILTLVAAERGIPTICMQHGIIGSEFGYIPKVATIDAVYGDFEIDWYKKLGVSEESLEVIGHPRFDQAFANPKIDRSIFNKQLGLDATKKNLMIVVRGNRGIGKWRVLIETISKKANLNILVKDYPNINHHVLTKEFPFVYSTKDIDLYDILPNIDAVVSYPSTVGLEAMLANKPVFILNKEFPGYTGYFNSLDELVQNDPQKLGDLVVNYFDDPNWNSYVESKKVEFLKYAYPDFSNSGERLKKLIKRLTK
ncbi:hypothetical protein ACFPRA_15380 [Sporosarcina soli]|uniref:Uncharacterized protein n=1 Tax=Sporosarcina soli TaxID=334736 RepID=A0ABW0TN94_9BACL